MLDNVECFVSEATPSEPENDICASKAEAAREAGGRSPRPSKLPPESTTKTRRAGPWPHENPRGRARTPHPRPARKLYRSTIRTTTLVLITLVYSSCRCGLSIFRTARRDPTSPPQTGWCCARGGASFSRNLVRSQMSTRRPTTELTAGPSGGARPEPPPPARPAAAWPPPTQPCPRTPQ